MSALLKQMDKNLHVVALSSNVSLYFSYGKLIAFDHYGNKYARNTTNKHLKMVDCNPDYPYAILEDYEFASKYNELLVRSSF